MDMRRTKNHSGDEVYPVGKGVDGGFGVERYEGDNKYIEGVWPSDTIPPTEHVHIAPCGGYFNHKHEGGAEPHEHTHLECDWCERNRA